MNANKKRATIAEACGFININTKCWRGHHDGYERRVPDYLADLNAMHEAESALAEKDGFEYGGHLISICDRDMNKPGKKWAATTFDIIHATAAQRAEAFLKTINKWTES